MRVKLKAKGSTRPPAAGQKLPPGPREYVGSYRCRVCRDPKMSTRAKTAIGHWAPECKICWRETMRRINQQKIKKAIAAGACPF